MDEVVLSAHARLCFEEAEVLVLQWFDEVGLVLGHAEGGLLIAWFDDAYLLPAVAEIAVEVQIYPLAEGWSQLRWCFRHGGSEQVLPLIEDLFVSLIEVLRADRRWSIDLCRGLPEKRA